MSRVVAIVPSAGAGKRFGGNKLFAILKDKPVLAWSLIAIQEVEEIGEIIPVMSDDEMGMGVEIVEAYGIKKVKKIAHGGKERQDSVYNGLKLIDKETSTVLIHDGVRPLVTPAMIGRALRSLQNCDGVIVGVPLKDTINEVDDTFVVKKNLKRDSLMAVQTPQVFNFKIIVDSYEKAFASDMHFTDDASVVQFYGGTVKVIEGEYRNIKITTPEDILVAHTLMDSFQEKESAI
jgi:2-C-methyl-D-erythritol 4-phosphate cytidylyltransferase